MTVTDINNIRVIFIRYHKYVVVTEIPKIAFVGTNDMRFSLHLLLIVNNNFKLLPHLSFFMFSSEFAFRISFPFSFIASFFTFLSFSSCLFVFHFSLRFLAFAFENHSSTCLSTLCSQYHTAHLETTGSPCSHWKTLLMPLLIDIKLTATDTIPLTVNIVSCRGSCRYYYTFWILLISNTNANIAQIW